MMHEENIGCKWFVEELDFGASQTEIEASAAVKMSNSFFYIPLIQLILFEFCSIFRLRPTNFVRLADDPLNNLRYTSSSIATQLSLL